MKRTLTGIAAAAVVLGTLSPMAFAATTKTTTPALTAAGSDSITLDGTTIYAGVKAGTAKDAGTTTTYFPIYYLEQALTKAGYTNSYNSSTHTWNLQIPGVDASKISVAGGVGTGNAAISINGIVVKKFNSIAHKDLAGGANAVVTTYFPLYYLGNVLEAAGFSGAWDGTTGTFGLTSNYGTAAGVTVTPASTSIVANGLSTETVTASVVDANGHVVRNFNGQATLHFDTTNGAFEFVPSTDKDPSYSDGIATTNDQTVTFKNGVATFTVVAGTTAGISDKIEIQNLEDSNGVAVSGYQAASASISTTAQVATGISVKPSSNYVETNDGLGQVTYNVNVVDQTGNPMLGGTYSLTGSLTGGGKFDADGATSGETIVVTGGVATQVVVDAPKGVTGTYTLTASGTGLTSGSAAVNAASAQDASKLKVAVDSASSSSFVEGSGNTVLDFSTTDANGVPTGSLVSGHSYALYLTDSKGNVFTDPTVTINSAGADNGTAAAPTADGKGYIIPDDATGVTITDASLDANAGTYSAVLKDTTSSGALTAAPAVSFTETAGTTVGKIAVTSAKNILNASGTTVSTQVTAQLEDANGNPISGNSDSVAFSAAATGGSNTGTASFNSGSLSATPSVTVKVDGNGVATVTFNAQNYGGDDWTVTAADGLVTNSSEVDVVSHPAAKYSFRLQDTTGNSLSYVTAGQTIQVAKADGSAAQTLLASAEDANGNLASAGNDNVTLTIAHASGITTLPTTSGTVGTDVTAAVNSSNDTVTLSGSLTNVSTYVGGLTLTAGKAGNVSFSLTDNSTGATGSASIDVAASTTPAGIAVPALDNLSTVSNDSAIPVTIQLVDAGGNPVIATSDQTVTLGGTLAGVTFQNASHVNEGTTITIPKGQSSVTGYLSFTTAGTGTVTFTDGGLTVYSQTITAQ